MVYPVQGKQTNLQVSVAEYRKCFFPAYAKFFSGWSISPRQRSYFSAVVLPSSQHSSESTEWRRKSCGGHTRPCHCLSLDMTHGTAVRFMSRTQSHGPSQLQGAGKSPLKLPKEEGTTRGSSVHIIPYAKALGRVLIFEQVPTHERFTPLQRSQ